MQTSYRAHSGLESTCSQLSNDMRQAMKIFGPVGDPSIHLESTQALEILASAVAFFSLFSVIQTRAEFSELHGMYTMWHINQKLSMRTFQICRPKYYITYTVSVMFSKTNIAYILGYNYDWQLVKMTSKNNSLKMVSYRMRLRFICYAAAIRETLLYMTK